MVLERKVKLTSSRKTGGERRDDEGRVSNQSVRYFLSDLSTKKKKKKKTGLGKLNWVADCFSTSREKGGGAL